MATTTTTTTTTHTTAAPPTTKAQAYHLNHHRIAASTDDSLSAQAGSFFRDIGLHPLCLVALLCALVIFPLAIAVPWVSIDHRDSLAEARTELQSTVDSALTQLTAAFDTFGSIINSQSAFVKSQLHLGPANGAPTWWGNVSERNTTIVTNKAWLGFVDTIQEQWPGLVARHFLRQMGITNKIWPPDYNGGAGSFMDTLRGWEPTRRRAAQGESNFFTTLGPVSQRLVYVAEHQIYRVRDPIFDFEYNATDLNATPANAHQFWGSTGCVFEAYDFIHGLGVVDRFKAGHYNVAVRIGPPNSNALDAELIDNTTDGSDLFRLCGGGAPGSRHCGSGDQAEHPIEIGYRQVNNDSALFLAATPKPGQWDHNFPIRTILFILFGALLVAFFACGVVTGLFYFLAQRKAKALNRVRYAPKTLPVPIAVLTIVDSDRIWSEDPLAMGAVTRELEKVIWATIQKYDAFQCRKIDDAVVLTARSPKKLLDCVSEVVTAMATHPWSNGESSPFVDQCVAVHATLHLCTRAKILFNPSRHPNRCDYSGGDYDQLFALHRRSLIARRLPIVLTEAYFFRLFNTIEEATDASENSLIEIDGFVGGSSAAGREASYRVTLNSAAKATTTKAKRTSGDNQSPPKAIKVRAFPPANYLTRELRHEFARASVESDGSPGEQHSPQAAASNAHNCSGRKLLSEALLPLFYAGSCRISLAATSAETADQASSAPPPATMLTDAAMEQMQLDDDNRESAAAAGDDGGGIYDDGTMSETSAAQGLMDRSGMNVAASYAASDADGSLHKGGTTATADSWGTGLSLLRHVCRNPHVAGTMERLISEMVPETPWQRQHSGLGGVRMPSVASSRTASAGTGGGRYSDPATATQNNTASQNDYSSRDGMLRTASYFYEAFSCAFVPFSDESIRFIFKAIDAAFSLTANRRGDGSRTDLFSRLAVRCAHILAASKNREARMHQVTEQQFRTHQLQQQQQQQLRQKQPAAPNVAAVAAVTPPTTDNRREQSEPRSGYEAEQSASEN